MNKAFKEWVDLLVEKEAEGIENLNERQRIIRISMVKKKRKALVVINQNQVLPLNKNQIDMVLSARRQKESDSLLMQKTSREFNLNNFGEDLNNPIQKDTISTPNEIEFTKPKTFLKNVSEFSKDKPVKDLKIDKEKNQKVEMMYGMTNFLSDAQNLL